MYSNTKVKNIAYQGKDQRTNGKVASGSEAVNPSDYLLVYDDLWWFMHSIDTISIYIP